MPLTRWTHLVHENGSMQDQNSHSSILHRESICETKSKLSSVENHKLVNITPTDTSSDSLNHIKHRRCISKPPRSDQLQLDSELNSRKYRAHDRASSQGTVIVRRKKNPVTDLKKCVFPSAVDGPIGANPATQQVHQTSQLPSIGTTMLQSTAAQDRSRNAAETEFYEHTNSAGIIRRRSFIRDVSKDDYLLARGANPRTGMITPGFHSASSSISEEELLKARDILPPAKWKLRDNQWVSCDPNILTPPAVPDHILSNRAQNGHANIVQAPRETSRDITPRALDVRKISAADRILPNEDEQIQSGVPGAFPETPLGLDSSTVQSASDSCSPIIKRKPVATSPIEETSDHNRLNAANPAPYPVSQLQVHASVPHISTGNYYSNLPAHAKYFSPADIGKVCNPWQGQNDTLSNSRQASHGNARDVPFLGPRDHRTSANASRNVTGAALRVVSNKALPSLPTSNGPFLSSPLTDPPHPLHNRVPNQMSQTSYPMMQNTRVWEGGFIHPYPNHTKVAMPVSNPPQSYEYSQRYPKAPVDFPPTRPTRYLAEIPTSLQPKRVVMGPRDLPSYDEGPVRRPLDGPHKSQRVTMSTNTGTFIHTSSSQYPPRLMPETRCHTTMDRSQNGTHFPQATNWTPPSLRPGVSMNTNFSGYSPVHGNRQHPMDRPSMPGRAEGMQQVPTVNPFSRKQGGTTMARSGLLNPTGMRTNIEAVTDMPVRLVKSSDQQIGTDIASEQQAEKVEIPPSSCLTRRCSRCNNSFIRGDPPNTELREAIIDQLPLDESCSLQANPEQAETADVQEIAISSETSETKELLSPMRTRSDSDDGVDQRDHSICCPECCIEHDCHEGCLGHPSPAPSEATRSERPSIDGTVDSASTESTPATEVSSIASFNEDMSRSRKLVSLRSAVIASFGLRKHVSKAGSGSSSPSRHGKYSRTPPSKSPSAVDVASGAPLWEGEGVGGILCAITAAKKAMGLEETKELMEEDLTRSQDIPNALHIPKKRAMKTSDNEETQVPRNVSTNSANEGRRVTSRTKLSKSSFSEDVMRSEAARKLSGQSIEVPIPGFNSLNFESGCDMVLVPCQAAWIWLRAHPEIIGYLWIVLERCWEMSILISRTLQLVYSTVYVYSKTGKIKTRKGCTIHGLFADIMKTICYLMILGSVALVLAKVIRTGFYGLQLIIWTVKNVLWLVGKGLLW